MTGGAGRLRLTAGVSRASLALLALIAYVPALLTKPGRMPSDTKLYLYLDPARLIADAPFSWDTRQFGGWVPHQTIAYLWPQGPWYWLFDRIGVPDWVAHRLWLGTLLFLGAAGVLWAARLLGLPRGAALAAAVVYQLSPYLLPYLSRTSAMLLPWAALGWIVGLTIRAATSGHRWRHPALVALVVLSCSAVNATAIAMVAPAPLLWLGHAVVQRTIDWRRAVATAARIGTLCIGVSLWWIVMLRTQGVYGADLLSYSESLEATSLTSTSVETLRGAGYWLFYIRDPYAFTTTAAQPYMEQVWLIAVSFSLVVLGLAGLAVTRWSQRRFAALLVLVGIVLAVGVHPIDDPSPLMTPLAEHSRSTLSLLLRSSTRALPLSTFGLALGAGALVAAIGSTRNRARSLAPVFVVLLAVANLPALFDGGLVDPALERDQDPPAAWTDAAAELSASDTGYRVLQLPGAEFGAFRWGYTVDPPLPGMTTKPLVTRDLLPLGAPAVMDLLYALDDRVQTNTLDPASLAPVARLLGVDTVWLANDLAFDRFRTPRPATAAAAIAGSADLGPAVDHGDPIVNEPDVAMVDERALVEARGSDTTLPPVQLLPVADPSPVFRTSDRLVVVAGSGDGLVDAAAAGLIHGDEAIRYAADLAVDPDGDATDNGSTVLVVMTDSNRDRAHHWRGSQDVTGFTETGGDDSDVLVPDSADRRLPVFGEQPDPAAQTVAVLDGGLVVRASGYGEPFAYRPEQRPAMAVDGDPATAWVVADRFNPVGQFLTVSETDGTLRLLQPQDRRANRMITSIRVDGDGWSENVPLDPRSLTGPGQTVDLPGGGAVTITITGIGVRQGGVDSGPSAVGFAELGVGTHREVVRLPSLTTDASTPLAVVLSRLRADAMNRWRSDPEPQLVREFTLDHGRSFDATVTVRLTPRATDAAIAALLGEDGPVADRRLTGDPSSRAWFVADGDAATAWTSPFDDPVGSTLSFALDSPTDTFDLLQPADDLHSTITDVRVQSGDVSFDLDVPAPDSTGRSTLVLPQALPRGEASLVVTGIAERTTVDRRYGETAVLPVAIRELSGAGLVAAATTTPDTGCRTDLLTIDGEAVGVEITPAALTAMAAGDPADVELCDGTPVELDAGTHRVDSAPGTQTAVDVDRITLRSGEVAAESAPAAVDVSRTRTTRTATVAPCPTGCWLIMGEGFNTGWTAAVGDAGAVEPVQIAGGMNGWWIPPSDSATVVHIEWTAQRPVTLALFATLAVVLGCIALALLRRPARRAAVDFAPSPPVVDRTVLLPSTLRGSVAAAAVLLAVTFLIAGATMAVLAVAPAVAIVVTRRPRLAGVGAVALMTLIAARVVQVQFSHDLPANAAWPGSFPKTHLPGMFVVALVLAAVIAVDDRDDRLSEP